MRALSLILLSSLIALASGCSSYQAGTGGTLPFESISVNKVENLALVPQAHDLLNAELRRSLNSDPRLQLLATNNGDAQLEVSIQDYRRELAATRSDDTVLARKYTLYMTLEVSLAKADGESYWFRNRPYQVSLDVFLDSGQTNAESQGLVLLCQKAADQIADSILQTW